MEYGHFDDNLREFAITTPLPPRPWINYLGNRKLTAFISQNAGGLLWHCEPQSRRITRYHYIPAPADRPGFYIYIKDKKSGQVWNPHYAPCCADLDKFEARVSPGVTRFVAEKDGIRAEVAYAIPPSDDAMLWRVSIKNLRSAPASLLAASYMEFGLLEFMREILGWCYLKSHFSLKFDAAARAIRYDYHVFEAPHTPRMAFGCTAPVEGFECSREAFTGRAGSLENPWSLTRNEKLSNSELPLGGHACATLGVGLELAPGEERAFGYIFAMGKDWAETDALLAKYATVAAMDKGIAEVREFWDSRLGSFKVESEDKAVDRFVNTWNPYNSTIALELARSISVDHMGVDGLRYRDTTQDALSVASVDPEFSASRMRLVFAQQTRDGGGCFAFWPHNKIPTSDAPHRSDNTVWQVYTVKNLLAEQGSLDFLSEKIPFRDGGEATVYEHILLGLKHIYERRGPRGLPTLFHADWNDGLALFQDEKAESVMLAQQLVYSCQETRELAERLGKQDDAAWCRQAEEELTRILNSDLVWDGEWYRRLLLSNGKCLGSGANRQGKIYLNTQSWAVIAGIGKDGRDVKSMDSAKKLLDTEFGLCLLTPPFTGIPEPEDPPLGSSPGTNENGGVFCHANTWAIIAECMLGRGENAFKYYSQLLPENVIAKVGGDHYQREPYVYASSLIGPGNKTFGQAGISWLTGTSSWMYIAATQYILGVKPTLDGLQVKPCLPKALKQLKIERKFRGCVYEIEIDHQSRGKVELELDGKAISGTVIPPQKGKCKVKCRC